MSIPPGKRRCSRCKRIFDRSEFDQSGKRIGRLCSECRREAKAIKAARAKWDCAAALKKEAKMRVHRAGGRLGTYCDSLDADNIRALLSVQEYRCALSGMPFQIPTVSDLSSRAGVRDGSHTTLTEWAKTLPDPVMRLYVPTLVRSNSTGDWKAGNVILVCNFLAEAYRTCNGSAFSFLEMARYLAQHGLNVPTRETLNQRRGGVVHNRMGDKK
jgi:hypothetical protein